MKKHDEGYVMILVLVVMIVMGLVTASILTFSLRNLQNQQLSIERMADKYAAQGKIEEYLAVVENKLKVENCENEALKAEVSITARDVEDPSDPTRNRSVQAVHTKITANVGSASILCELYITGEKIESDEASGYIIINPEITYTSYKITYSNGETEEEVPAT